MTAAQLDQLVENVKRDGKLTSTILAYRNPDNGELEILSGHHRAEAAKRAELREVMVEVITTPLSEQRKTAIQLSHNAIVGQDDATTLLEMYRGLDLDAKTYSGLTDDAFDMLKDVELIGLNVGGPAYREMQFFFLPEDEQALMSGFAQLEKAASKDGAIVAHYKDFERFFDAMVKTKTQHKVFNSAIALRLMVDLALERLKEIADGKG